MAGNIPTAVPLSSSMLSHAFIPDMSKMQHFDGKNYRMWSDKMEFFLGQIGVDYTLLVDVAPVNSIRDFDKDNKTCRGMLLHYMTTSLYMIHSKSKNAKDIWDALKSKYGTDDFGTKKYACSRWLNFRMTDDKPVLDQVHEYENLCADIIAEGMKFCDQFQANCLLEKLPPSWQNYVHSMKHKQKDFTLQELVSGIKIEEQNRIQTKGKSQDHSSSTANLVESKNAGYNKGSKGKGSNQLHGTRQANNNFKGNRQFKGNCFTCGKFGHIAKDCRQGHGPNNKAKENKAQANLVEDEIIAAVVSEVNLVSNVTEWVLDTGATRHICSSKEMFKEYEKVSEGECVFMGNSSTVSVLGKGKVFLKLTSGKTIALQNVLHVPDIRRNLISGALLNKAGIKLTFESDKLVLTRNGDFVGKGFCNGGLFVLDVVSDNKTPTASVYIAESVSLWHSRLGHVNVASVKRLKQLSLIPDFSNTSFDKCEVCVEAKHPKKAFNKSVSRTSSLLELVHSDLGDFKNSMSRGGKHYYITFVDDFSRFTKVYLLSTKDEAEEKFLIYKAEVENQLNLKIKRLRSDRGGEYDSNPLKKFCETNGIIHETTAPYTPEQNGIAERKNRTLKDMMNAMLISSGMPTNMWGEAILSACYVLNRVPHKKLDKTPFELWRGFKPNLSYLKVWGCLGKIGLPDFQRSKIGPKTVDGIFIGYASNSAAYRLILKDASGFGPIRESRDVEFFEHIFPMKLNVQASLPVPSPSSSVVHHDIASSNVEPRRSKRARTESSFGPDFITAFLIENEFLNEHEIDAFILEENPRTYGEAMRSVDSSFWLEAINSEIESIMSNNTWVLTELPRGCKALGSKWIFTKKEDTNGNLIKFKARLVVGGHHQKKGLDFFDTYSPVTKVATIRALIALASIHDLIVHQMDVKTAFLNGDLKEEIYMKQPEGCIAPGQENKVCKLIRSLYGLKQAPKQWYDKFHQTIISDGFCVNDSDACVYSKLDKSGCVIICLYVDDMLIFGTNIDVVNATKAFLNSCFEMKDLGEADVILGIKIIRTSYGLSLNQSHYVEKILKKFNQFDCTPAKTPYDSNITLKKNKGDSVSQEQYAKIIGSVMFLMNYTRPDIAYAVSRLSRYTHSPNRDHWNALIRLLRYLKGTINWGLHYHRTPCVLEGYCDANWVSDNDEIHSTSGYVFTLASGAISWKSSKQTCIAKSTMESEFIALELAGQEAEWLRSLLADIPLWGKPTPSVSMHCDSQAAIGVANNQSYNGKRRHIRVRHAIVRDLIRNNVISLEYVKSERNIADPLTKGLCKKMVHESAQGMGLKPIEE